MFADDIFAGICMNRNRIDYKEIFMLIILFCFSVSLFNLAGVIFSGMIALMYFFNIRNIKISVSEWILALFSFFYFLITGVHFGLNPENIILFLVGPLSAFLLGKLYVLRSPNKNAFLVFIVVLAAGMCLHGFLNLYAYINSSHFSLYQYYRRSVDFWRGTLVNVNTTGMFFTFATGISLGVLFSDYSKKAKIISVLVISACIGATVFFANRALILVVMLVLVWKGIVWLFSKKVSNRSKILTVVVFAFVAVLAFVAILLFFEDFWAKIGALKIVRRFFDGTSSGRFGVWAYFFKNYNFIRYPMGGDLMLEGTTLGYLHNMWLDVYNQAGVIPFVLLSVFTVLSVKDISEFKRVMNQNGKENEFLIFQCLVVAILFNCAVEPTIEANPYYFAIVLMFLGAMNGYKRKLLSEQE